MVSVGGCPDRAQLAGDHAPPSGFGERQRPFGLAGVEGGQGGQRYRSGHAARRVITSSG